MQLRVQRHREHHHHGLQQAAQNEGEHREMVSAPGLWRQGRWRYARVIAEICAWNLFHLEPVRITQAQAHTCKKEAASGGGLLEPDGTANDRRPGLPNQNTCLIPKS